MTPSLQSKNYLPDRHCGIFVLCRGSFIWELQRALAEGKFQENKLAVLRIEIASLDWPREQPLCIASYAWRCSERECLDHVNKITCTRARSKAISFASLLRLSECFASSSTVVTFHEGTCQPLLLLVISFTDFGHRETCI
jgi:hypothetical protein